MQCGYSPSHNKNERECKCELLLRSKELFEYHIVCATPTKIYLHIHTHICSYEIRSFLQLGLLFSFFFIWAHVGLSVSSIVSVHFYMSSSFWFCCWCCCCYSYFCCCFGAGLCCSFLFSLLLSTARYCNKI